MARRHAEGVMPKTIIRTWEFRSSTNLLKFYRVQYYSDGSFSCNCPGWTKRAVRMCRHVNDAAECLTASEFLEFTDPLTGIRRPVSKPVRVESAQKQQAEPPVKRRFRID
jgi:hypothetical protein